MEHTLKPRMTPKFFFLSLGVIITLITSVTAFLNLAFDILMFKFPDVLNATYQFGYNSYNYDSARAMLAILIIFFPLFLVLMNYWKKTFTKGLGSIDAGIRKWMLYLVLFLSTLVIAIDLVTLVQYFVSGEITTRFILKVVVTLLVALFVGVYYIFELQERTKIWKFSIGIWSAIKSSIIVLALIIWSFIVIGSPAEQRAWRLDEKRVQDLQNIQSQVINTWQQKEKLPLKLSDMANPLSGFMIPVDPEFEKGKTYEYTVLDAKKLSFELCATFSAPMPKGWIESSKGGGVLPYPMASEGRDSAVSSYPYPGAQSDSWDHETGRTCFTRTIDKDIYPPYTKMKGL
jgi:hypothetical protein